MAGPAGGASSGGNYGGNVNADQDYGGRDYRDQSYATKESINRADNAAAQRAVQAKQRQAEIAEEQKQKARGTGPQKTNLKPTYAQNFRNKVYQYGINNNKVEAMRKMNLMQKGLPGMWGKIISGLTGKVPDWAQNLTEEELVGIATSGPYLGQQKTVGDVSKFSSGKDLLGRVTEGQSILDRNGMTQTQWDELFPSNITTPREGNDNILPKYAMMGGGADMGSVDVVEEDKTYDWHIGKEGQQTGKNVTLGYYNGGRIGRADGGIMGTRARRAMGGIMGRVDQRQGYFLGGIGRAIKGAVSGVVDATKKVLKSNVGKMALMAAGTYYMGGGNLFGMQRATDLGKFSFGQIPGAGLFTGDNSILKKAGKSLIAGDKDSFMDKAIRAAKWGGIGYGLSKTKLGEAKPNEVSYMGDRANNKLIDPLTNMKSDPAAMTNTLNEALADAGGDPDKIAAINKAYRFLNDPRLGDDGAKSVLAANGGRISRAEGGLMDLGGMEKDYRAEGGFVPLGAKEKADDVPARLSVNEFVFTADAVRGAGGGDIDKGAEIMENMMVNLEKGGTVSEESQGNAGAQQMFNISERLGEVI